MIHTSGATTANRGKQRGPARMHGLPVPKTWQNPIEPIKLRYVSGDEAGYRRVKRGKSFTYLDEKGKQVTDERTLKRIRSLVLPPAWKDVWISKHEDGHLQATGIDAKGRKQYRYHAGWRQARDQSKYEKVIEFGRVLPKIRASVAEDLKLPGLPRHKVLATVVRLLETTLIRVGNEEYARTNNSFGLTTMRDHHVAIRGCKIQFNFRGKSGKTHEIALDNCELAKAVKKCRDVPGQELFQYVDTGGRHRSVSSTDVNAYLKEVSGENITAKDFRTWAGTVLAALALRELDSAPSLRVAKKNIVQAIESVSMRLGNTPSICRKCYVHPAIFDSYLDGSLVESIKTRARQELDEKSTKLTADEKTVMRFLKSRLSDMVVEHNSRSVKGSRRNGRSKSDD